MSRKEKLQKRLRSKQFWLTVSPLFVLLMVLAIFNLTKATDKPEETAVASQSTPTRPTRIIQTPGTRPPILPATILPSPTPTLTPRPTLPETAAITLFGPPAESSLPQNGRTTFYWTYSEPLLPSQQFVLTLQQEEAVLVVGTLRQPNVGTEYQLLLDFNTTDLLPGTAVWQLQLEWIDNGQLLLASEERSLILLPD